MMSAAAARIPFDPASTENNKDYECGSEVGQVRSGQRLPILTIDCGFQFFISYRN